jgi:hypothetical protein
MAALVQWDYNMEKTTGKINVMQWLIMICFLIVLTAIFMIFGDREDIRSRLLLNGYVLVASCLVYFVIVMLYADKHLFQAVFSLISLLVAYIVALYCIWISPEFYAKNWKLIHVLLLWAAIYPPTTFATMNFLRRKNNS